jgi:hypothetical protein
MNRRSIVAASIGILLLIVIGVGIYVLPRRHVEPFVLVPTQSLANSPTPNVLQADSTTYVARVKSAPVLGLWVRPAAKVAARNVRRCSLGATLKPIGASDSIVERLTDGDIQTVVSELKQQARAGDAAAGNQLDYMAHLTCRFAGLDGADSDFYAYDKLDAHALSIGDGGWIRDAMLERETFNRQLSSVCQQSIDKGQADTWVTASAAQGDPQSHYMLAMFGPRNNRNEQFVVAAQGGVPWAQFGLAQLMLQGVTPAPGISNTSENAGDLLRAAAVDLPQAKSDLAQCEFRGCTDIPVDIPSAVTDAREAAERGAFEAMLEIGPQLQASQIDPDEVEAWNLVHAALEMQGSAGMALSVQVVKSASSVLNSPTITTKARTLAEEYWREYGTQMLRNLGCQS